MNTSSWTAIDRSIGIWSAIAIVVIAIAYILTGLVWVALNFNAASTPRLQPTEPYLTILETLILLITPAIVLLFSAIHAYAPSDRKACSRSAFGFALLLAGITGVVHFTQLTVVRRAPGKLISETFALYDPMGRLTPVLATDLIGWDFFFGFALLCAAMIFRGDKIQNIVRVGLFAGGGLCLAGLAGPASGNFRFQYPAIVGYAFVFPVICLVLVFVFKREQVAGQKSTSD